MCGRSADSGTYGCHSTDSGRCAGICVRSLVRKMARRPSLLMAESAQAKQSAAWRFPVPKVNTIGFSPAARKVDRFSVKPSCVPASNSWKSPSINGRGQSGTTGANHEGKRVTERSGASAICVRKEWTCGKPSGFRAALICATATGSIQPFSTNRQRARRQLIGTQRGTDVGPMFSGSWQVRRFDGARYAATTDLIKPRSRAITAPGTANGWAITTWCACRETD